MSTPSDHSACTRTVLCVLLALGTTITAPANPLSVFLQEGFNGPGLPAGWSVAQVSGTSAAWNIVGTGTNPPIPPYEGAGQAQFNSYDAAFGDQARLVSRSIDLTTSTDPYISFFMYHDDEFLSSPDSIYVEATTGDSIAGPWSTLAGYCRPQQFPGWKAEAISLLSYSGSGRFFVSFRGVSQYGNNTYVDKVIVADSSFHDIGVLALSIPTISSGEVNVSTNGSRFQSMRGHWHGASAPRPALSIPFASPLNIGAIIQNYGAFAEPSYQVQWQIDGLPQTPVNASRTLARDGRDTLTLSWLTPGPGTHTLAAWTSLNADSNRSNDSTRQTIVVLDSNIIFVETFNASTFPPPGWATVNRDGGALPPWFQGQATSIFLPYEGTGFAADNFQRANGTYIDDYLISPPIPGLVPGGRADSLGFWVRSAFNPPPELNYPDSLMILLSTTGADTSNFTTFLDYFSVPKTGWTFKAYQLAGRIPSNSTVRVAFRYLHYNGGPSGSNSDFVGVDLVHVKRGTISEVSSQHPFPPVFSLEQNYPNPFNPSTEVDFSVARPGTATLAVYNILGQKVSTLFDGTAQPGLQYRVRWDGSEHASGTYYCVFLVRSANGGTAFSGVKRMLLLK